MNTDIAPHVLVSASSLPGGCVPPFRVLVVCTGNIYRSPLAECLLRHRLVEHRQVIHVSSAGTRAVAGVPAAAAVTSFLAGRGLRPCGVGSRRLTEEMVENADLVLGAATEHREAAVRLSPVRALSRAFTFREFARLVRSEDAAGVADPAARFAALVQGAAARRGVVSTRMGDVDVKDPLGAPPPQVRECLVQIEEAVERITALVRTGRHASSSAASRAESGTWR
ncbi:low molecular weight phosphatase family protein [Streptomyces sp. NPDC096046]|uniref:arsenate reductase/protein-tyrosine-phosphatase family protein n=1 Tax=Streptomyces sp. NPDC096046 TaxID=3155542 RepID=UPI00332CC4E5